ncbi:YckD family protein [Peribacillus muralis]|uniref:YckD family protein n=1 Tax=Peribacillus muralis TaxID=264697 RepID=UPI001F4EE56F|nr:YckD family protein [Peribacillus muralis]MCK1991013.1 YckD family protein [Peribacillus muralis]MCK2011567.1 YckD family protein [Peribacillus muralis]
MKKFLVICLTACSLFLVNLDHPAAQDTNVKRESVKFTEAQKTELANIQKRILADKKVLIEKYVEYGALTKEEGDKMLSHFEKHYKMMEEHNFQIPPHRPHSRHMHQ